MKKSFFIDLLKIHIITKKKRLYWEFKNIKQKTALIQQNQINQKVYLLLMKF